MIWHLHLLLIRTFRSQIYVLRDICLPSGLNVGQLISSTLVNYSLHSKIISHSAFFRCIVFVVHLDILCLDTYSLRLDCKSFWTLYIHYFFYAPRYKLYLHTQQKICIQKSQNDLKFEIEEVVFIIHLVKANTLQ